MRLADLALGNGDGFIIPGLPGHPIGTVLASGQDVNGDGTSDILIGSSSQGGVGDAYLVWGHQRTTPLSLTDFVGQGHGFPITGPSNQSSSFGVGVALLNDVNRDGLADFVVMSGSVVGASMEQDNTAFVLFGSNSTGTLDAANAGALGLGYRIDGTEACHGGCVAGVGDQNGDGREDVAVPLFKGGAASATLLIAFGQSNQSAPTGIRVVGSDDSFRFHAVSAGGDVNGDGRPDLLIGAERFRDGNFGYVVYVVFGPPVGVETLSLSDVELGQGGFVIREARFNDLTPELSVATAGDLNGDGLSDILVGAPGAPADDHPGAGRVYVVFGKSDTAALNLAALERAGTSGFVINGAATSDQTGRVVAGIGDQNGDGVRDILIGAPGAEGETGASVFAGVSYVVFGKSDGASVALSQVREGTGPGFAIVGGQTGENSGSAVASGDVNGDGTDDILVGAPYFGMNGAIYVSFGRKR